MKRFLLLAAASLVLAAPSVAAQRPRTVDLSDTFPSDLRNQCSTGSCHTFSSIAILESAYKRYVKTATGRDVDVRFSEADLFIRKTVLAGKANVMFKEGKDGKTTPEIDFNETGSPKADIAFALKHGVAFKDTVPWSTFYAEYRKFRDEKQRACTEAFQAGLEELKTTNAMRCLRESTSFPAFLNDLKLEGDDAQSETTTRLIGDDEQIALDRAESLIVFAHLSVSREGYSYPGRSTAIRKEACREEGEDQGEFILGHLVAGRPVAVCFHMEGLPIWGRKKKKSSRKHCVAVTGYTTDVSKKGRPVTLQTRNSWVTVIPGAPIFVVGPGGTPIPAGVGPPTLAPKNYPFPEHHFCSIHSVIVIEP